MSLTYIFLNCVVVLFFARFLYRRFKRRVVDKLPGPPPTSWLTGNIPEIVRSREISDAHFAWTADYGTAVKIHGEFRRKLVFLSDPKAIKHILNTSGYNFPKPLPGRVRTGILLGKGLVWAEGSQHAQQRKLLTPVFSFNTLRGFIPMFRQKAQQTSNKIKEHVEQSKEANAVVDIVPWLSRTTLDIMGIAIANYDCEAIDNGQNNKLTEAYNNIMADVFFNRSDVDLAIAFLMSYAPESLFNLMKRLPTQSLKRISSYMSVATEVAQEVVDQQTTLFAHGKEGSKDLMSVLVRANLSENPKTKLSNEEVIAQLTTFFFAGHETTSSSIVWALYELSRHPEYQTKVREEIKSTRARVLAERKDGEITISDLDAMQLLPALVKETLRFHPIVGGIFREAGRDDDIPLAEPVTLTTGEVITSLPVERGQEIMLSFIAYNRMKSVWGEDADVWRPERFLEEHEHNENQINVGVIGNISSFSSGIRSCIGWRFAVLEMQAILFELIDSFEFSPPPGNIEILRVSVGVMGPMVKGSKSNKTELPLTVRPLQA